MKRVLVLVIACLTVAGHASAQRMVGFGIGPSAGRLAWRTFAHHNALAQQQLWLMHQRNAQLQMMAAYSRISQHVQEPPQLSQNTQWQQEARAQQERMDERIRELKEQQQRIEARLLELHTIVLTKQSEPVQAPVTSKMATLRSELELLRQALNDLKDELGRASRTH